MLTEIDGIEVGHHTNADALTGCTVVLFPDGTVASGEVRGGAPATRDFALLEPQRLVSRLDAVVLSGGSAFGLAAGDGVMGLLAEREVGFPTASGPVPIVVGLSLFDLGEGDGSVRPTAADGRAAALAAAAGSVELGRVGAGTGATVSKWRGRESARPGGLGGAVVRSGDLVVAALIAVNASGDIDPGLMAETRRTVRDGTFEPPEIEPFENTTIGVVATNATLTKLDCHRAAQSAHDGYARAILPAHTVGDGDAVVVGATGVVEADPNIVRLLTALVVEQAIGSLGGATIL